MNWMGEFIEKDPVLSSRRGLIRHKYGASARSGQRERVHRIFHKRPMHYFSGGRWREIDTRLKSNHSGIGAPHLDFKFAAGAENFNGVAWKPVRIGGHDGKRFYPIASMGDPILGNSKIYRPVGPYEYYTEVLPANVKGEIILDEVPSVTERYFAIEYKLDHLAVMGCGCIKRLNKVWGNTVARDALQSPFQMEPKIVGGSVFLLTDMRWLNDAVYPVRLDPQVSGVSNCFYARSNAPGYNVAHMDPPYCPFSCDDDLNGVSVGQAFQALPNRYSVARWAVAWDLTSLSDTVLSAYSSWAKFQDLSNLSDDTKIYTCDWSAYDGAGDCQVITCTNVCNLKEQCRTTDSVVTTVMTSAWSLDSYRNSGAMGTAWINSALGDHVYYVVKSEDDDSSTAPPSVGDSSMRAIYGGPASSYPAILNLTTEEFTRVFGTIVG
jgi:hypothetical protein